MAADAKTKTHSDNGGQAQARIAPHSVEAEEAALGAILINPDSLAEVAPRLSAGDFFIVRHRWIWEAMCWLREQGMAIDYLTLVERLSQTGQLDEAGGRAYITYLINNTPTSIHADTYARVVENAATRRKLLDAAGEIARLTYNEESEIESVLNGAEEMLLAVTGGYGVDGAVKIDAALGNYYDRLEYLYTHQGEPAGIPTGFKGLDKLLGGMHRGDLWVVAARPGMGKTSWLTSVALNAARYGQRVAIFSMEMTGGELVRRLVASETGIDSEKLRLGNITTEEWARFVHAADRLSKLHITLDDTPDLSISAMQRRVRRLWALEGVDLVLIDYLQLMNAGEDWRGSREREVGQISQGLKTLAKACNVPVVAAAQLSRAVEQRQDKRPMLSDLRESGHIEQAADAVLMLYWDERYNPDTDRPGIVEVNAAKHRNGRTGSVDLFFQKKLSRFGDVYAGDMA